jgi:hypothetical protein
VPPSAPPPLWLPVWLVPPPEHALSMTPPAARADPRSIVRLLSLALSFIGSTVSLSSRYTFTGDLACSGPRNFGHIKAGEDT